MHKVNETTHSERGLNRIVSGFNLALVRIGVGLTILMVSFRAGKNPFRAVGLLRSLIRQRVDIHENKGNIKVVRSCSKYYWSINIPGWPSESFNNFIYNEFQRINSPHSSTLQPIILGITNLCPLNCIHCYESENLSDKNSLSFNDLKRIMDRISEKGIRHIQLSGGEPLSRFDDMIDLIRYSGMRNDYWVNTSGFGLSYEKALKMKEAGVTGVVISLDDWDESRHNAFRGNSKSFYWVQEAARNCKETGIIVCLSLCPSKEFVTQENLDRYHMLAKEMSAGFIRIMEPRNAGRYSGKNISLDAGSIAELKRFMILRNSATEYVSFPIILFSGHYQRKSGCLGAGNRFMYIDSNGNFQACPFCRKPLGNALTEPLDIGIKRAREAGCHSFKQQVLI